MKFVFGALLLVALSPVTWGFAPVAGRSTDLSALTLTNKYPSGRPNTDQVDEDMAMWFEDKQGRVKKALEKPVGGRPLDLYTKDDIKKIETRGVDPFEKAKRFAEFLSNRPRRGY